MKIKNVTFENFKCFKNITLELGKLTLLTGANSSGKSSIIYGILGSIQSGEFPFQFSPNGQYVDMGDFIEISNNHDKNNLIKITYTIEDEIYHNIETVWGLDEERNLPKLQSLKTTAIYFTLEIVYNQNYDITFNYDLDKDPNKDLYKENILGKLYDLFNYFINKNSTNEKLKSGSEKTSQQEFPEQMYPINPIVQFTVSELADLNEELLSEKGGFVLAYLFTELKNVFIESNKRINYISSSRLHPERTYYEQTKSELKIGKCGEQYTDQIIQWETKNKEKYNQLVKQLNDLMLLNEVKTKRTDGGRYELLVRPQANGQLSSLADVGFGISQFLPILVADIQLGDDSILFVSQPEIHLHPSIQANFADYLLNQINTTNKTYIIETHSEYLINRLRLGIVKETVKEDDIKAYYFRNTGDDVENFPLQLTKDGQIKNAPKDFFETYSMDVMDIAINAAQ